MMIRTGFLVVACILQITSHSYLNKNMMNLTDQYYSVSSPLKYSSIAEYNGALEYFRLTNPGKMKDFMEALLCRQQDLTPMEGLDLVHEQYASNFEKVQIEDEEGMYYYQWPGMTYYLIFEDKEEETNLYRLYEFVLDDEESGIGHTVTYGWYRVNRITGEITEWMN